VYLTLLIFGLLLFGGSLAVSSLAASERLRLLLDLGLAGIECIALLAMVFLTVGLVLEEVESQTINLILAHPVPRPAYVGGRFLGTFGAVAAGMALMALLHLGLLAACGWRPGAVYALAWACILCKIAVTGALALALSLFSSSANAAMVFTAFLWTLGHFSQELSFLAERSGNAAVRALVWTAQHAAPDMAYFNYRDMLGAGLPAGPWYGWTLAYTLCYAGLCLYVSCWVVSQKEF
jgi:hypothetical protein